MYGFDFSHGQDVPLGLSMALAQNPKAFDYMVNLAPSQRQQVINMASCVQSKSQMNQIVNSLAHSEMPSSQSII